MTRTRLRKEPNQNPHRIMTYGAWDFGAHNWIGAPSTASTSDLGRVELCIDELHKGPPYKSGGPLTIRKYSASRVLSSQIDLYTGTRRAVGYFVARTPLGETPALQPFEAGDFGNGTMGAKGWNKFRPGNPAASMGQFVAELRQIPTIPFRLHELGSLAAKKKRDLLTFKQAGKEYLNVQFGWIPFVNDLRKMVKLARSLHQHLAQLKRDNGKKVRREGTVSSTETSSITTSTGSYLHPILTNDFYVNVLNGKREITDLRKTRHWFSAAFRYWVPDIGSDLWTARATAALFGVAPTPDLLYQVMPWSWLIDWFSNAGDVISNMSMNAVDNLAAEYAYIMTERLTSICYNERMQLIQPVGWVHASTTLRWETKLRSAASPYGFGLLPSDLSARQQLILSALGISRSW